LEFFFWWFLHWAQTLTHSLFEFVAYFSYFFPPHAYRVFSRGYPFLMVSPCFVFFFSPPLVQPAVPFLSPFSIYLVFLLTCFLVRVLFFGREFFHRVVSPSVRSPTVFLFTRNPFLFSPDWVFSWPQCSPCGWRPSFFRFHGPPPSLFHAMEFSECFPMFGWSFPNPTQKLIL